MLVLYEMHITADRLHLSEFSLGADFKGGPVRTSPEERTTAWTTEAVRPPRQTRWI